MSSDTEILSWQRAAVRLGWGDSRGAALRLGRMVRRREREISQEIAVRRGALGGWSGVTMASLRSHFPQLFRAGQQERDELQQRLSEYLATLDEKVTEGVSRGISELVDPRIDELHGRDAVLERRIHAVECRVGRLEKGPAQAHKTEQE